MKHLILDRVKRLWWWWLMMLLMHGFTGFMIAQGGFKGVFNGSFGMMIIWANPTFCLQDLNRGYARLALTLPFTTRQIGRAIWLTSAGLTCLLLSLGSFIGFSLYSGGARHWEYWLVYVIACSLLYGALFWFFSGSPQPKYQSTAQKIWGFVYGLVGLGMFVLFYFLLKDATANPFKAAAFFVITSSLSVLGWLRAEGLIVAHGEARPTAASSAGKITRHQVPDGFGGIPYLLTTTLIRTTLTISWMTAVMGLVYIFFIIKGQRHLNWKDMNQLNFQLQFMMFIWMLQGLFMTVSHIRFLRTLPYKPTQLAGILLTVVLLPWFVFAGLFSGMYCFAESVPKALLVFESYLLGVGPLCVMALALVWYREKRFWPITGLIAGLLISGIPVIYHMLLFDTGAGKAGLPLWAVIGYPLLMIWLAVCGISMLIEKNPMTYRIKMDDWNRAWGQR